MHTLTRRQFAWLFVIVAVTAVASFNVGRRAALVREASASIIVKPSLRTTLASSQVKPTALKEIEITATGARLLTLWRGTPDEVTQILIPTGLLCSKKAAAAPQQRKDCKMAGSIGVPFVSYTLEKGDAPGTGT